MMCASRKISEHVLVLILSCVIVNHASSFFHQCRYSSSTSSGAFARCSISAGAPAAARGTAYTNSLTPLAIILGEHHMAKNKKRSSSTLAMAQGFGTATVKKSKEALEQVQQALHAASGNVDMATTILFQLRLAQIEKTDARLFEEIKQLSTEMRAAKMQQQQTTMAANGEIRQHANSTMTTTTTGATSTDIANGVDMKINDRVHEALVKATWDAVAIMLPTGGGNNCAASAKPSAAKNAAREAKKITRRLVEVAKACYVEGVDAATVSVLDVGCGDGTLVPYLMKNPPKGVGVSPQAITGIDLSEEMINIAQQKNPKAKWLVGNMLSLQDYLKEEAPRPIFSAIVFNGSLQFFQEPITVLKEAAKWLRPGGHLVISHVQGAAFVAEECASNSMVARCPMPSRAVMEQWAAEASCTLLPGADDDAQQTFYLMTLLKDL